MKHQRLRVRRKPDVRFPAKGCRAAKAQIKTFKARQASAILQVSIPRYNANMALCT